MFVLDLLLIIFKLLEPLISLICDILSYPMCLLQNAFFYLCQSSYTNNFIGIYLVFLVSILNAAMLLNIPLIILFYSLGYISSWLSFTFCFVVLYSGVFLIYKMSNLRILYFEFFSKFFGSSLETILITILIICLILCIYNAEIFNALLNFRNIPNKLTFVKEIILITFYLFLSNIIVILHFLHPFALLRITVLATTHSRYDDFSILCKSLILIPYDFILTLIFVLNIFLNPYTFIKNSINCFKYLFYGEEKEIYKKKYSSTQGFEDCHSYNYIRHIYLENPFFNNIKYIVALIILLINLILVWKIKTSISIFLNYIKNKDFKLLAFEFAYNVLEGLCQINYPIIFLYNRISSINRGSIFRVKKYLNILQIEHNFLEIIRRNKLVNKNKNSNNNTEVDGIIEEQTNEITDTWLNLNTEFMIFENKQKDVLFSILISFRSLTLTFILLLRKIHNSRKRNFYNNKEEFIKTFAPLLKETDDFYLKIKEKIKEDALKEELYKINEKFDVFDYIDSHFAHRRLVMIKFLIKDILGTFLMITSFVIGFIHPYTTIFALSYTYSQFKCIYDYKISLSKTKKIINQLIDANGLSILNYLVVWIILFPTQILLILFAPWNLYSQVIFGYTIFLKQFSTLKKIFTSNTQEIIDEYINYFKYYIKEENNKNTDNNDSQASYQNRSNTKKKSLPDSINFSISNLNKISFTTDIKIEDDEKLALKISICLEKKLANYISKIYHHTFDLINNLVEGWKLIIKILIVHLTVIRIYFAYYDILRISRLKKGKVELTKAPTNNYLCFSKGNNPTLITLSYSSNFKIYSYFIHKHAVMALKEFFLYGLLILYYIITPWNYKEITLFLKQKTFYEKYTYLISLSINIVFYDFFVMIGTVCLLLSGFQTYSTIKLIYFAAQKRFSKGEFYKEKYDILYKHSYKKEIYDNFSQLLTKVTSILLVIINFCLILRIFSLMQRLYPFIRDHVISDFMIVKAFIYKEKVKRKDLKGISTLRNYDIAVVSQFLTPKEITNFSLTNKKFYNKLNSNLVWEYQFRYYYVQKLLDQSRNSEISGLCDTVEENSIQEKIKSVYKANTSNNNKLTNNKKQYYKAENINQITSLSKQLDEIEIEDLSIHELFLVNLLKEIKVNSFDHHKELCKKLNNFIVRKIKTISSEERDMLIGYFNVIIEETIESIVKIPHLILIPVKIICIPLLVLSELISFILKKIYLFMGNYLIEYFYVEKDLGKDEEFERLKSMNLKSYFYNIQYVTFISIVISSFRVIHLSYIILSGIILILLKLVCFENPKNNNRLNNIYRTHQKINPFSKFIQSIYSFIYTICFWVLFIKIIIYFNNEEFNRVYDLCSNEFNEYTSDHNFNDNLIYNEEAPIEIRIYSIMVKILNKFSILLANRFYSLDISVYHQVLSKISILFLTFSNIIAYSLNESIFWIIKSIFGKYFSNAISYSFMLLVHFLIGGILEYERIKFLKYSNKWIVINNYFFYLKDLFFIHFVLFRFGIHKILHSFFINIYILFCIIYPIIIFFYIPWNFYNFIIGILYICSNIYTSFYISNRIQI